MADSHTSKSQSLVERLRAPRPRPGYPDPLPAHPWMVAAADEIERLQLAYVKTERRLTMAEAQNERLRAALERFTEDCYNMEDECTFCGLTEGHNSVCRIGNALAALAPESGAPHVAGKSDV